MSEQDLSAFVISFLSQLRERGTEAVATWVTSVQAGHGGDLLLRAPCGKRILPEAGFKTEGYPG
jgi:hypothetical protein